MKLKDELQLTLPSTGRIILPATSFHSKFTLSCKTGYEVKLNICMACEYGTHSTSMSTCEPCERGFFSDVSGSGECQRCPFGKTTIQMGATSDKQCVAIQWWDYAPGITIPVTSVLIGVIIGVTISTCKATRRKYGEINDNASDAAFSNFENRKSPNKMHDDEESDELSSADNSELEDTYGDWGNDHVFPKSDAMELITRGDESRNQQRSIIQTSDESHSQSDATEQILKTELENLHKNDVDDESKSKSNLPLGNLGENSAPVENVSSHASVKPTNIIIPDSISETDSKLNVSAPHENLPSTPRNMSTKIQETPPISSVSDDRSPTTAKSPSLRATTNAILLPLNKVKQRKYQELLSDVELE